MDDRDYDGWKNGIPGYSWPGDFNQELLTMAIITYNGNRHGAVMKQKAKEIIDAWEVAKQLFEQLPPRKLPFEQTQSVDKYQIKSMDYIGRYLVDIRRPTVDAFVMTLGMRYQGNFWKQQDNVTIIGYYLIATNGNLDDCKKVADVMKQLLSSASSSPQSPPTAQETK